jgi:hypothetical protein
MGPRIRLLFFGAVFAGCAVGARAGEKPINIKGEEEGKYFVVEAKGTPTQPIILVKFVSPQGASYYTRRLMDCKARTTEYLGEGETLEESSEPLPEKRMIKMEEGSVAEQLWTYACRKPAQQGKSKPAK